MELEIKPVILLQIKRYINHIYGHISAQFSSHCQEHATSVYL
jgi:hypothetical protein